MNILQTLTLAAVPILVVNSPASAEEKQPNRWAILIGIDDYIEAQDLKYCGADQKTLRDRLVKSGFAEDQVFVLHDKATDRKYQPTKRNIEKQLDLVLSLVDRGDVVLLSFSGHGVHFGGKSFLAPNDAELGDPETLIDTKAIYDLLKQCPASLKVMLIDACRNDPRPGGQRAFKATDQSTALARSFQESTPEGIVLLNSWCAPGEISWEEEEFGHGVFMNFVLDGLKGQADRNEDGEVSLAELSRYANLNTKLHVARRYNDSQRPFITNESTLDALNFGFPFVSPPPPPKESLANSIGMTLKLIPAGEFMMGSRITAEEVERRFKIYDTNLQYYKVRAEKFRNEHPRHRVRITHPFYMGAHVATIGQFRRFVKATAYRTEAETDGKGGWGWNARRRDYEGLDRKYNWKSTGFTQTDSHPVVNVTWNDAQAFCKWLSTEEGVEYRLPTEAEWEYAARAGTSTLFYSGDNVNDLQSVANLADLTAKRFLTRRNTFPYAPFEDGYVFTAPVGRYRANDFGLYDVHGNVYEWCSDWYSADFYERSPLNDPPGPSSGASRVIRGASWSYLPYDLRSANRDALKPDFRDYGLGFRVVRVLE